jgi:hypothetical protein
MRKVLAIISWVALGATILPSLLYLGGGLDLVRVKFWMLVATGVWFATVPWWMDRKTS